MKKTIFLSLFLCLFYVHANAQNFEGRIVYENTYKSKIPNVSDDQFNAMMGNEQTYLIKGGNYKSIMDGTMMQWQLYLGNDNKLYMKMAASPVIYWSDGAVNTDEVQKAEINKGVETILGHLCDELVLTCKSGVQRYYFSPKVKIDPKLYSQHKFGNWSEVVSHTKSLPLKIVVENAQFTLVSTATEISPEKLEAKEFELPPGSELQKSPY